jgi:hypothetical protein
VTLSASRKEDFKNLVYVDPNFGGSMELTTYQKEIHEDALRVSNIHEQSEADLVKLLQKVAESNLHKALGCRSPYAYTVKYLRKAPPFAYALGAVARKSKNVPQLLNAIETKKLNVWTANRLVSQLTSENAEELIHFAETHSYDETERELGRRSPRKAFKEKVKYLADNQVAVTSIMSIESFDELERFRSLEARKKKDISRSEAIESAIHIAVTKMDPVRKAERAQARREKAQKPCSNRVFSDNSMPVEIHPDDGIEITYGRENMTANQINAVMARDKGACIYIDADGNRCGCDRFTEIHHKIRVADGGSNHPSNLRTLCWFHHDLIHQMEIPNMEYSRKKQPSKNLRDRQRPYVVHRITTGISVGQKPFFMASARYPQILHLI